MSRCRRGLCGTFEGQQNAIAHFGGSLARERDGQHLLRMLHGRQQAQVPLCEQLGLTGTGGCLDNERRFGIERLQAHLAILQPQVRVRAASLIVGLVHFDGRAHFVNATERTQVAGAAFLR